MEIVAISTPGPLAARQAMDALRAGKHVVLLSTGVTVAEEAELKRKASERGLLLLGPGCGTSILDGEGFGIWNHVRRGPVGIVCTAGSGAQEISCLVDEAGISHVLGVGPRDLSQKVSGVGTISALKFLAADDGTEVIVLAALPPTTAVSRRILDALRSAGKPAVVCFLGGKNFRLSDGLFPARTLEGAAARAVSLAKGREFSEENLTVLPDRERKIAELEYSRFGYGQRYIRGLYSGGMICMEAQVVLRGLVGQVLSNVPLEPRSRLPDPRSSRGHACVDMGSLVLSEKGHPAVDLRPRCERLLKEAKDWETAVIILDVVLGEGAHLNPAGELGKAVREAKRIADESGGYLSVVASITGTGRDPQNLPSQREILEKSGVLLMRSSAHAARIAALIAKRGRT